MNFEIRPQVAIINYGMGNLFSVAQACRVAGLHPLITAERDDILNAAAVILPGVGAFGTAMERLHALDLVSPLRDLAESGHPLMGICLGMQLVMSESNEFGFHQGLNLVPGVVSRLTQPMDGDRPLKVPHVGWNKICSPETSATKPSWDGTLLSHVSQGEYMYFVHSYRCTPADASIAISVTTYGGIEFCSTLRKGNIFGCQYHPERSGTAGLAIYQRLAETLIDGCQISRSCNNA